MKKLFFLCLLFVIIFEIASVFFIMPMPGSQEINSIDLAYFLYGWRWFFRVLLWAGAIYGIKGIINSKLWVKILSVLVILISIGITYITNFKMAADTMFYQPTTVEMQNLNYNKVDINRLIIGIEYNNEAKAYPIQYIGYHHQVRDIIGGKEVMITYCTVCRTGRVYEPKVNGKLENFRLVGMDHFNAMFEDETTKSWWRQVTGEAIAGELKGQSIPVFPSMQTTLSKWKELHPNTLVFQGDKKYQRAYNAMDIYENGSFKGKLTRLDTNSWKDKSWVVGVIVGKESKAFDWNDLKTKRAINDEINGVPVLVILSKDLKSFVTYQKINNDLLNIDENDLIIGTNTKYYFDGTNIDNPNIKLKKLESYQEYWHSWKTFHPNTKTYNKQ